MEDDPKTDSVVTESRTDAQRPITKHILIWGALALGAIIVLAVIIVSLTATGKTAFTINNKPYSESGLNAFINSAATHKVSKSTAKSQYISFNKDQFVANELNISVSNSDIFTAAKSQFVLGTNQSLDNYENLTAWDTAFHNQILLDETGGIKGALLNFPFDNLFIKPTAALAAPKNFGNASNVIAVQQYALKQANYYHGQLMSGKISTQSIINALEKDQMLIATGSGNGSYSFTVNGNGVAFLNQQYSTSVLPDYVLSAINSLMGVGITNVKTETISGLTANDVGGITLVSPQPISYYIVDVQSKIDARPDIGNQLNKDLNSLKVVINA